MKRAYQEKVLDNFAAIEKRTKILNEIIVGARRQDPDAAKRAINEINRLIESSRDIVSIVPTQ